MKAAPVKDLKTSLEASTHKELLQLCLRLIKFKKENKELATYFIFESSDESAYVIAVKDSLDLMFAEVNKSNVYYAKKTLRKILRNANKFIKYSEVPATGVEILLYVAEAIRDLGLPMKKSVALAGLYGNLLKKIEKSISMLHEDLQYDYQRSLQSLTSI